MIVRFDLSLLDISHLLWGLSLSFTPLVLPIAFLFSMLLVFGRMSSDKEWVAASAMGYSSRQMLRAPFFVATIVSLAAAISSFSLGPYGNRIFEIAIDEAVKRKVTSALKAGTFSEGFLDLVVFVDQIDPATSELERVFVYDESNFDEDVSISAKKGIFVQSRTEGVASLKLKDGSLVSQNTATQTLKRIDFSEYVIHADYTQGVGSARNSPPSLAFSDLIDRRQTQKKQKNANPRPVWVELAKRFAVAFLSFCFVPLAFGVSLDNSRTAKTRSVFYGLIILVAYWTVYFTTVTWVLKSPYRFLFEWESLTWALILMPNFLTAAIGFYIFRKRTGLSF